MKKIILVDGNNLLFRSYYATAYNGNFMNNSKGFPTNALFGFTNMINKIINEEKPEYIIVAFDKGKTFRHEKYDVYKDGRTETPNELKIQFPLAKELLTAMGIKYYEIDNYEADDIIGTFSEYCNKDSEYVGTIISSDKDLLQLISEDVDIKLLKQKDYIRYNKDSFEKEYGIKPINIIDLKALMGDSSDNIPGVKGVGEKTALKLLHEYKTLDGIYENIDKISGKLQEKLINDKDNAYMSYDLATIIKNVPVEIDINDIKYKEVNIEELNRLYEELEFYSFLKKNKKITEEKPLDVKIVKDINELEINGDVAVSLEVFGSNYHTAPTIGMGVYNNEISAFIPLEVLKQNPSFLMDNIKYTYDVKKIIVALKYLGIEVSNFVFDTMIAGSLLDYNVKDDMAYLANEVDYKLDFYETIYGKFIHLKMPSEEEIAKSCILRAKFIFDTKEFFEDKLKKEEIMDLYEKIELPLASVLADMEFTGVKVDRDKLISMGEDIQVKLEILTNEIYNMAGCQFNISSPMQLSEILFEKLGLPHGKKTSNGYSTAADVLHKIKDKHPIVNVVLEYRGLSKLYSTYIEGLQNYIIDGRIHTIYTQNLTRTGRLSSIEPNLQNIPIRDEVGRSIRKAFVPTYDYILGADYSQIELRILAHIADVPALEEAFKIGMDIHAKTASDIFKVPVDLVTSDMRRVAKAVNFGIIYGISGFGLGENLDIRANQAKEFINTYLETYPGIKEYMDDTINHAKENGYVRTLFNRKRNIPELKNPVYMIRQSGERIALNTPIQGTSADIIKLAMIKVYNAFKEKNLKSKMIIQVHDELIFDVVGEELEIVQKLVSDIMENVYKLEVPLNVDVNYGKNWFEAK
ncbi:MAG: DNA polymerase I [Bacilli bacterium]|nr:DNA polymerase I [Bacilli bacterium]